MEEPSVPLRDAADVMAEARRKQEEADELARAEAEDVGKVIDLALGVRR